MRKRAFATALLTAGLLGWYLRFYPWTFGSSIPTGYSVSIDWTRYHILQTGHIETYLQPKTLISSYHSGQTYDFSAMFLALVSIVIGEKGLDKSIYFLNAIPIFGLVLLPLIIASWYSTYTQHRRVKTQLWSLLVLVVFALFPSQNTILKTRDGYFPEVFASATLLMVILTIALRHRTKKMYILFAIFVIYMMNLWHTWVFYFLLFASVLFFSERLIAALRRTQPRLIGVVTLLLICGVFFLVGWFVNDRFEELVITMHQTANEPTTFFDAAESSLIGGAQRGVGDVIFDITPRRGLKIASYISSILIVSLYALTRMKSIIADDDLLRVPHERLLLFSLPMFGFIGAFFYVYGGINTVIGRMQYIGVYWTLLIACVLMASRRDWLRTTTTVLVVLTVLTSASAVVLHPTTTQPDAASHTYVQAEAINFTGSNVPDGEYVFSDTKLGVPLLYYNQRGIAVVQVIHDDWEQRMRDIYFNGTLNESIRAIEATFTDSSLREPPISPTRYYLLVSKRMDRNGIHTYALKTKPPNSDFYVKFERGRAINKVYSSEEIRLFEVNRRQNSTDVTA